MDRIFAIPQKISGVTVDQYVRFQSSRTDVGRAAIATGKSTKEIEGLTYHAIDTIITLFEEVCSQQEAKHEQTFVIGDMRLGFIPDLNAMSFREFVDLDVLSQAVWQKDGEVNYKELPRLLAILFRPVKKKLGVHYELQPYDAAKIESYMPFIQQLTMDRVNGALLFFSSVAKELQSNSQVYLLKQMKTNLTEAYQLQVD